MTNKEHHKLLKICFDGSKHLKHVLSDEHIRQMTMIENRWPLTKLPVCGHCEKLGYWHQEDGHLVGACPKCGTITKNPVTYSTYLASGYDVDATGETARAILDDELTKRRAVLPEYINLT